MTTFATKWAASRADADSMSRPTPQFVARLQAQLSDPDYHRQTQRQLRLTIVAIVISLVGAVASVTVLLGGGLEPRIGAFWLLCGLLSLGLFVVAEVALIGGYVSQLAVQRLANGQKDCEVFDAVRDYELLHVRVAALQQLSLQTRVAAVAEAKLLVDSVDYLADLSSLDPSSELEKKVSKISKAWKAFGADDGLIARFAMKG